jgi:hypothetical protein
MTERGRPRSQAEESSRAFRRSVDAAHARLKAATTVDEQIAALAELRALGVVDTVTGAFRADAPGFARASASTAAPGALAYPQWHELTPLARAELMRDKPEIARALKAEHLGRYRQLQDRLRSAKSLAERTTILLRIRELAGNDESPDAA